MGPTRSFWHWGYEDKFPKEDVRAKLAGRLEALFGGKAPEARPSPAIERIRMPEPRYTPPVELRSIGTTDRRERALHTYGRAYRDIVRAFAGDFTGAPDWVFYPTEEEHIVALYRFCEAEGIALVPFGGGTSVVGGVEAEAGTRFRGVASVDLSRMDRVLDVDVASRAARIQAGATGPRIAEQLSRHGLTLRHYPQSYEFSTLGGWLATRSGGHYATLHTHIDDFVQSLRLVTPAGVFETRRLPASGAGPRAEAMVLGSEGAFGIITEAWMRVQPRPRWRASASVRFDRWEDGVAAARALSQSGLYPSNCRLLDAREAMLHRIGDGTRAILLLAFESADHPIEPWMERALSIATDLGGDCEHEPSYAVDVVHSVVPRPSSLPPMPPSLPPPSIEAELGSHDSADASAWKHAFYDAPYLQSALVSLGVLSDTFETACTWERFHELHGKVVAAVEKALRDVCGAGVVSCRFTHVYPDGPAPYYTVLAPAREGAELEQWTAVKTAASEAILASGGTITHHHGVGRIHRPFWQKERPALFEDALVATKERLDPRGILNPGCLLPTKG
jgi:alkyldihydroxyacetonephosphate synthase